jgi:dolichol-phosphate mannosyltransferase
MPRIFSPQILERPGFESMVELIMKLTMLKLSISEVAMQLDSSLSQGKSKMRIFRTVRGYLTLWFRKSSWEEMIVRASEK